MSSFRVRRRIRHSSRFFTHAESGWIKRCCLQPSVGSMLISSGDLPLQADHDGPMDSAMDQRCSTPCQTTRRSVLEAVRARQRGGIPTNDRCVGGRFCPVGPLVLMTRLRSAWTPRGPARSLERIGRRTSKFCTRPTRCFSDSF